MTVASRPRREPDNITLAIVWKGARLWFYGFFLAGWLLGTALDGWLLGLDLALLMPIAMTAAGVVLAVVVAVVFGLGWLLRSPAEALAESIGSSHLGQRFNAYFNATDIPAPPADDSPDPSS